jgi:hypothetical protein
MKTGDYALGIEPGNCHPDGRALSREKKESEMIEPGGARTYRIKVGIIENAGLLRAFTGKYGISL